MSESHQGGLILFFVVIAVSFPSSLSLSCYSCSNLKMNASSVDSNESQLREYLAKHQTYGAITELLNIPCSADQAVKKCPTLYKTCITSHIRMSTVTERRGINITETVAEMNIHLCGSDWLVKDSRFCELTQNGLADADITSRCLMDSCSTISCNIPNNIQDTTFPEKSEDNKVPSPHSNETSVVPHSNETSVVPHNHTEKVFTVTSSMPPLTLSPAGDSTTTSSGMQASLSLLYLATSLYFASEVGQ